MAFAMTRIQIPRRRCLKSTKAVPRNAINVRGVARLNSDENPTAVSPRAVLASVARMHYIDGLETVFVKYYARRDVIVTIQGE